MWFMSVLFVGYVFTSEENCLKSSHYYVGSQSNEVLNSEQMSRILLFTKIIRIPFLLLMQFKKKNKFFSHFKILILSFFSLVFRLDPGT
jgi:hypothetical protein